jgi:hypothetical protein
MAFQKIETAMNPPTFRVYVKARPLDFRFSERGLSFRRSHKVPLVKPTLADNTEPRWRFNSGPCLHSESKTAKSSSRVLDIERCIIRENHEIPWRPSRVSSPILPPASLLSSELYDVLKIISHLHSRDSLDNRPSKYLFFGPAARSAERPIWKRTV